VVFLRCNPDHLENRVAIVTGAAGAIGGAIARRLGSEGARLALLDDQLDLADYANER
jgi:NAD(P)-dependent dehydrogenase (short-subunit alcohol dehydrogenase family)